jgi:hypothetical protein
LLASCGEGDEHHGGGAGVITLNTTPALALFAGSISDSGSLDGPATTARFNRPTGVATDSSGNIFVVDSINQTVRKITPSGTVTTVVGTPGTSSFTSGALPGTLSSPPGISISGTSLYITSGNGVAVVNNLP